MFMDIREKKLPTALASQLRCDGQQKGRRDTASEMALPDYLDRQNRKTPTESPGLIFIVD
jgi:hypothetical protein